MTRWVGTAPRTSISTAVTFVIPTRGQPTPVCTTYDSVRALHPQAMIIVVDQNPEPLVAAVLPDDDPELQVLRDHGVGVSAARNTGLLEATTPLVMFLDDDARLTPGLERFIDNWDSSWEAVCGRVVDLESGVALRRYPRRSRTLGPWSFFLFALECAMIFDRQRLVDLGGYDESIGVGQHHGADEGVDLHVRMLREGGAVGYRSMVIAEHPQQESMSLEQRRSYGRGTGHVIRKHISRPTVWPYALRTYVGLPLSIVWRYATGDRLGAQRRVARLSGVVEATFERS